jgi:uncharacterized membrane protein YbhN (UPF0104 family)
MYSARKSKILGTISIERIVDMSILAFGVGIGIVLFLPRRMDYYDHLLFLSVFIFLLATAMILGIFHIEKVPIGMPDIDIIKRFFIGITVIRKSRVLFVVTISSLGILILTSIRFLFISSSIGYFPPLSTVIIMSVLITFLYGIPLTPGGLGITEIIASIALVGFGLSFETSLSIVVLDRLVTSGSTLCTGTVHYIYLKHRRGISILN